MSLGRDAVFLFNIGVRGWVMTGATAVRVLVAVADQVQREALRRVLEPAGAVVEWCADGQTLVEVIETRPDAAPDLVIVAGMDAPTTVWALRRGPAIGVAIYAVLHGESKRLEKRLRDAGCNGFLDGHRCEQLPAIVARLRRDKEAAEQPAVPAPWACGDLEQGPGYEVESMDVEVWLEQQRRRAEGAPAGTLGALVDSWLAQRACGTDGGDLPRAGDDLDVLSEPDEPFLISLDGPDSEPRPALPPVAPAGLAVPLPVEGGVVEDSCGCSCSSEQCCPHLGQVIAAAAAQVQQPDGAAERMLEGVLGRFVGAQLPAILAGEIGRAQASAPSSGGALQALRQMNDQFRERLLGEVSGRILGAIGETEQQAHAMAASVARQALAEALPSVYRQLRLLICGVGLLGFAVAAGAAYVVAAV